MRRFELNRIVDESGVSGTGTVAEGVIFHDGTVALKWRTAVYSMSVFNNIEEVLAVHGHQGATEVVFIDPFVPPVVEAVEQVKGVLVDAQPVQVPPSPPSRLIV